MYADGEIPFYRHMSGEVIPEYEKITQILKDLVVIDLKGQYNSEELRKKYKDLVTYAMDERIDPMVEFAVICDETNNSPEVVDDYEFRFMLLARTDKTKMVFAIGYTTMPVVML